MRTKSAARVRKRRTSTGTGSRRGGQSHRRADHHLLGDEALVEALRVLRFEPFAERRILDIGVERDDTRVGAAESGERGAVRFARRDRVAKFVNGGGICLRPR